MTLIRKSIKYFIVVFATLFLQAGDLPYREIRFDHLTLENGLSESYVSSIFQDSLGFLWFGTADGLNLYDGVKFTVFKHDPGNKNSLVNNYIYAIEGDGAGNIWIGTMSGLSRLNTLHMSFTNFIADKDNPNSLPGNSVTCVFIDSPERLWVGTTAGLSRLDLSEEIPLFKNFKHDSLNPNTISNNYIRSIYRDADGFLWLATDLGLNKFDPTEERTEHFFYDAAQPFSVSSNKITCIFPDPVAGDGVLWIGTGNGVLNKFDRENNKFYRFVLPALQNNNGENIRISEIVADTDNKNLFWLATWGGGLYLFDREKEKFRVFKHSPQSPGSLSSNFLISVLKDFSGNIWVGTADKGISKFNNRSKFFHHYFHKINKPYSLSGNYVNAVFEEMIDEDTVLWVGTSGSGLNRMVFREKKFTHYLYDAEDYTSLGSNVVWSVFKDSAGKMWIGTSRGLSRAAVENGRVKFYNYFNLFGKTESNVVSIEEDGDKNLWLCSFKVGVFVVENTRETPKIRLHFFHNEKDSTSLSDDRCNLVYKDSRGNIWVGTYNGLNLYRPALKNFKRYLHKTGQKGTISNNGINCIFEQKSGDNTVLWIGTDGGLNKFDYRTGKFVYYTEKDGLPNNVIYGILGDKEGCLWLSTNKGISRFNPQTLEFKNYNRKDGLQSDEFNIGAYAKGASGMFYFGGVNGLTAFDPEKIKENSFVPNVVLTEFRLFGKKAELDTAILFKKKIELSYNENFFSISFAALDYTNSRKNKYRYKLQGVDPEWRESIEVYKAVYTKIVPGNYLFRVQGSNNDYVWNEKGASVRIIIVPPVWQRTWFKVLSVFLILGLSFSFFLMRIKYIKRQKIELEKLVAVRTADLIIKNREIHKQKEIIEEKNFHIMSSIRYAERIQKAISPSPEQMRKALKEHFVIYLPKDIVSGDFYWVYKKRQMVLLAVVDCTGHGVPGAFMSLIGNSLLNQIVKEEKITDPAAILEHLHLSVREILKQENGRGDMADGMDVGICQINYKKREIIYAGAGNSLYVVTACHAVKPTDKKIPEMKIIKVKGNRQAVGGRQKEKKRIFSDYKIRFFHGDFVYLVSDGFIDQNDSIGKRFGSTRFVKMLNDFSFLPADKQKKEMLSVLNNFMDGEEQRDDITVIGFKMS